MRRQSRAWSFSSISSSSVTTRWSAGGSKRSTPFSQNGCLKVTVLVLGILAAGPPGSWQRFLVARFGRLLALRPCGRLKAANQPLIEVKADLLYRRNDLGTSRLWVAFSPCVCKGCAMEPIEQQDEETSDRRGKSFVRNLTRSGQTLPVQCIATMRKRQDALAAFLRRPRKPLTRNTSAAWRSSATAGVEWIDAWAARAAFLRRSECVFGFGTSSFVGSSDVLDSSERSLRNRSSAVGPSSLSACGMFSRYHVAAASNSFS